MTPPATNSQRSPGPPGEPAPGPDPALRAAAADRRREHPDHPMQDESGAEAVGTALRDIGDVPAVEVVTTVALHLMSAAAVKLGLGTDEEAHPRKDLAEARTLITALAGLVTAAAPSLGTFHAAPLRDGLQALQRSFREESLVPDAPGDGPGEQLTGPVR
jgi:hypothetical protein